jgi:hypothetical protein
VKSIKFPPTQATYYQLKGGLDLVTPPIAIDPGRCFDAQNYEPVTVGGYRRLDGFERFDGRPKPSDASYWLIDVNITGALAVGNTVTGVTSAATGKVLAIGTDELVLGRVSGTFVSGEVLNVGGTPRATTTSAAGENSSQNPSTHADNRLLAADDRRADIAAVPGSGPIRGVFMLADVWYALRDNAGATAGAIYKQTSGGWSLVSLGNEIQFTGAVAQVFQGNTITGASSGATATVARAMLRTGTWTAAGAGTLILTGIVGTFTNGENLQVGGVTKVVASGANTAITRAPGGNLDWVTANFTGSTATRRVYGADGANLAFEFDGTIYAPIRTGMTTDTPRHIAFHKNRLFLSFLGSLQYSAVGEPFTWTAVLGANEISTGDPITALKPQTGNTSGASLAVACADFLFVLYGNTNTDFQLVQSNDDLGFGSYTIQSVGNDSYGLTSRGIQALTTTLNYGDFNFAAVSFLIQPLLEAKRAAGYTSCGTTIKGKNQYRLYFSDNSGIIVGLTGGKVAGLLPVDYGLPVLCISTCSLSTGEEQTMFGSDDGFVYQDNVGTSFDGEVLPAWVRPVFNNLQSPLVRKQFRRAVFEVKSDGFSVVNITYDIGYATPAVSSAAVQQDITLLGDGGYWDQFIWNQFTWDSPVVSEASISIDGIEKNISFFFYSNRAQDDSHTVQGISLLYTPRRLERS